MTESFEGRIDAQIRKLETEMALALNYVREIAKAQLSPETIKELEAAFEARVAEEKPQ